MTEQQNQQQQRYEDEIDLKELFIALWKGKWIIIAVTFVFAVGSVMYAINQPNIYRSEALLAPVEDSGGMNIPGQLGGLAALAGVNLGGSGGGKVALALEVLKSREFLGRFIEKYDLKAPIMAAENWNRGNNTLVFDGEVYNPETNEWVREAPAGRQKEPSLIEVYEELSKLLSVSQDTQTGMVKISIEHYSPYLAKNWVELLVNEINEEMRNREMTEASNSIQYLESQLSATNLAEAQSMLFSLIEEQTKTLMLANVRPEYILRTLDPAIVPELKAKPSRAFICILGIMLGGMLSCLYVLIRYFQKKD
ncbi:MULTISPECIES: Wzz/FepE/Etk N-terminal domain-containing protein [Gammaproteobacteria]|uniref:Wzz/FepE/Etk N-terminal domain-containing protein n=1 Tax=Gammaproteobacteria TaxID=1236 RepID=UPI000DD0C39A|nr:MULTISPECIES: Wzz/FepE/Etk N-terminal domain-containing protein [Gammaproteobacteria]RTE86074.1 LPS O-antigen length regulator [Aliidiomarina sp. B3213]TCZ91428.1 LPS O-antigen length regulator [Lysobacter sp. N42]